MGIKYYIIVLIICFSQNLNGQSESTEKVKIMRTYSENEKLKEEVHYDRNGRKLKLISFNVAMCRLPYFYNVDSIVRFFLYDSINNKVSEFGYLVRDSIREKTELITEHYYNEFGQIILKKHTDEAFPNEYFSYDAYGNLIKDSSDLVYLFKYEYSQDSLILKKSKYENNFNNFLYIVTYEYDSLNRLVKDNYYNYDNKLTEVTIYQYDKNNNLVFQKTVHLDVYTVQRQRKDKEFIFTFEYNKNGQLVKEISIGQWNEPKIKIYKYEYY